MADKNSNSGSKQADGDDNTRSNATPSDKEGMGASGGRTGSGVGKPGTDAAGGGGRKGQGGERDSTDIERGGDSDA